MPDLNSPVRAANADGDEAKGAALDNLTLRAVRIVGDSVRAGIEDGPIMLRHVAELIDTCVAVGTVGDLDRASGAFNRMDGGQRRRIAIRAVKLAQTERGAASPVAANVIAANVIADEPPKPAKTGGMVAGERPLFRALNGRVRKTV